MSAFLAVMRLTHSNQRTIHQKRACKFLAEQGLCVESCGCLVRHFKKLLPAVFSFDAGQGAL
ncbi:hypothetical protein ACMFCV_26700 (plasmid) [Escherichia coli]